MTDTDNTARSPFAAAATLAALAAICTALVATTYSMTSERIEDNRQRLLEASLKPLLEGLDYEGTLSDSTLTIPAPNALPGGAESTVFRVFADGRPLAALFDVTPKNGYAGPIRLLVGVDADDRVTRVRVVEHRETPGLGDRIEASKSDWIEIFSGHSLGDPIVERWEIRRDGGEFDQLSGASITSRAVVRAVRDTLIYFEANRERLFAPGASDEAGE